MYFSCLMDGENVRTDIEECFKKGRADMLERQLYMPKHGGGEP